MKYKNQVKIRKKKYIKNKNHSVDCDIETWFCHSSATRKGELLPQNEPKKPRKLSRRFVVVCKDEILDCTQTESLTVSCTLYYLKILCQQYNTKTRKFT